jgi:hypothetical protein
MARAQDRLMLLALSGGAHVVALGWLMTQRHDLAPTMDAPAMQVFLAPPMVLRRAPPPPRQAPRPHTARSSERAPVVRHDAAATPVSGNGEAGDQAVPPAVRRALRGLIGCRLADLSDAERQRCEDRLGALEDRRGPKLNLDVRGAFARDPDPYLARKPKDGCKVRAGGDADPAGEQGAAIGIGCAWSF